MPGGTCGLFPSLDDQKKKMPTPVVKNFDKIHSMSIEDMAEIMRRKSPPGSCCDFCPDYSDLIRRNDVLDKARWIGLPAAWDNPWPEGEEAVTVEDIDSIPAVDAVEMPETGIGDLSDGYHTFNELYHQRAILFAALVKAHKSRAWKSWRHSDGELPFGKEDYFIVGIDTPEGSYTYHYHGEYWDMFDCQELPLGKEWDGHTDKDVTRLLSLPVDAAEVKHGRWIPPSYPFHWYKSTCSVCGYEDKQSGGDKETLAEYHESNFCPNCGARMDGQRREEEHREADRRG